MLDPVPILAVALAMALLFAAAAAAKLGDFPAFREILRGYRLLPDRCVGPAAGLVVLAECLIAAAWLVPPVRSLAAWCSAALLLGYGAAMAANLWRGRVDLDCGCSFGAASRLSWSLVVRNVVLAVVTLIGTLPATARATGVADVAVAAGAGLVAVMLYLAVQQLLGNAAAFAAWRVTRREV